MAIRTKGNVKLEYDTSATDTPSWVNVPGVFTNSGGGRTVAQIDATDFDSSGTDREFITGLGDNNARTFEMHYAPGDTTQEAIRTAHYANTPKKFRLTWGTAHGTTETYTALYAIESYGDPTGPIDGKLTVSFQLKQSGSGTWA